MNIRDHITITQTSPGLYAARAVWGDIVMEATELSHEDAWPVGYELLCDMMEADQ